MHSLTTAGRYIKEVAHEEKQSFACSSHVTWTKPAYQNCSQKLCKHVANDAE